MRRFMIFVIMISAFVLFNNNAFAQKSLKIGVVDVETIVKEMPEALTADKQLKDMQKQYNDSLVAMQEGFYKKVEDYQKQKAMMTPDQQQKEEQGLKMEESRILQFRELVYEEIQKKRDEFLTPIREKVRAAIEKVAKEESISLVLDKASPSVLFAEEKFDITFKVLDNIKRGNK